MAPDPSDQARPANAATSQRSVDQLIFALTAALVIVISAVAVISIQKGTVEPVKELAQMLIAALAGALTTDAVRRWQRDDEKQRWPDGTEPGAPTLPPDLFAPDPAAASDPPVAGWYHDPNELDAATTLRWWDGTTWTDAHRPLTPTDLATTGDTPP